MTSPQVGELVAARFRLQELIGRGGMGAVWKAWDEKLDRQVAVKCALLDGGEAAGRLKKEARYASRLHHPNIVQVFDLVEDGSACWIVMEYVPSRSLAQLIADGGPLTPGVAGSLGAQIAAALVKSHTEGVVHGDVTPENILVTDDGVARLMDFGIARVLWSDVTQTLDGAIVRGKPRYLAPESVREQRTDEKSDVFSLGATVYAAVEGRSPYGDAESPVAYLTRALSGHIEPARQAGPLTEPLAALLELDPRRRPDAVHARRLLASAVPPSPDAQADLGGRSRTLVLLRDLLSTLTVISPRSVRRRRRPLVATALLLVAAVTAGLFITRPWDAATDAGKPGTIGDVRTADPCGLMSTASLEQFGDVRLDPYYDALDRCDVVLSNSSGDDNALVMVDLSLEKMTTGKGEKSNKVGDLSVGSLPLQDRDCRRTIGTVDGRTITVTGRKLDDSAPDVCSMADAATAQAVAVLERGAVPRRTSAFPSNSLAQLNACTLLDATAVKKALGAGAKNGDPGFGKWSCDWWSDDDATDVQLQFSQDGDFGDDDKPVTIAGKKSYYWTEGSGEYTACYVDVPNRTFKAPGTGDTITEYFELAVTGPGPAKALCTKGEALAPTVLKNITKQFAKD